MSSVCEPAKKLLLPEPLKPTMLLCPGLRSPHTVLSRYDLKPWMVTLLMCIAQRPFHPSRVSDLKVTDLRNEKEGLPRARTSAPSGTYRHTGKCSRTQSGTGRYIASGLRPCVRWLDHFELTYARVKGETQAHPTSGVHTHTALTCSVNYRS